ncbi:AfsR/SARP family transcriptional regulator [Actinocrispum wychmicini]|nr:BTAD domain-containing putative transcriptional regulator [Actinocrispum wychmicini]
MVRWKGSGDGDGFRVLGPFEVWSGGRPLDLGGPKLRVLLALLAANDGRVVRVGTLVDELWGVDAPPDAHRTVRTYMSRLRRVLAPVGTGLIVTRPAGYLLRLEPDALDADVFERLVTAGRAELANGRPTAAADALCPALALWRGEAYGEFGTAAALRAEGARLHRLRLAATEDRVDAELAAGAGESLVAELTELTERHPGHDRLWRQLMIAQYRAGRQADALETFLRARAAFAERAGIDPPPALAQVHRQVLAGDPSLLGHHTQGTLRPAQLPPDVAGFTGRDRELAELDSALAASGVVICAVSGTAGVGKTTLALHWAHQVADRFPDGQLYVNLRGFTPTGSVSHPATAIRGLLDALGTPRERIPAGLDEQAALYRSRLAGTRTLVVLDNARDVEQVRPLLPGAAGCAVVVTSRNRLDGLVTGEGAHPVVLDLLAPPQSWEMLSRRLSPGRIEAEPDAVAEITNRCGGLPLALAIVAGRAALHPKFSLASLALELRQAARRLDGFTGGDPTSDLRTVFSWSYHELTADAARLFRLTGLAPGPDLTAPAAASLLGTADHTGVRGLLAELARAHLIVEHTAGRYTMHELLRGYATELAGVAGGDDPRLATHRLLDHYLHTAQAAARLSYGPWDHLTVEPSMPGVTPDHLTDRRRATEWFIAERPVLLAAVDHAACHGFARHAWQLAWTMTGFLEARGYLREWAAAQRAALTTADPVGQAHARHGLGHALAAMGRYPEALTELHHALDQFAADDNHTAAATTRLRLGLVFTQQGDHRTAIGHTRHALDLFRAGDHRYGQARALNNVGWGYAQLGRYEPALRLCEQALVLNRELRDACGQAATLDSIGYIHHRLGRFARAATCFREALDVYGHIDHLPCRAETLNHLSDTYRALNDHHRADEALSEARPILESLDHAGGR